MVCVPLVQGVNTTNSSVSGYINKTSNYYDEVKDSTTAKTIFGFFDEIVTDTLGDNGWSLLLAAIVIVVAVKLLDSLFIGLGLALLSIIVLYLIKHMGFS